MKQRKLSAAQSELREEFPSGADYVATHATTIPDLVELRLTTGQGTSSDEVILVAELWGGEAILFDPQSGSDVAIWFDQGWLRLKLTGCEIRAGSRFGERMAPDGPKVTEVARSESSTGRKLLANAHVSTNHTELPIPSASGTFYAYRKANTTTSRVTKRENSGARSVTATGSGWHIRRVTEALASEVTTPTSSYKYISTEDRLCDLAIRSGARKVSVQARLCVFPNDIRYRVRATGTIKKFRARLSTNQDKIIQLLLKNGIEPATSDGLQLAKARLKRRTTKSLTKPL